MLDTGPQMCYRSYLILCALKAYTERGCKALCIEDHWNNKNERTASSGVYFKARKGHTENWAAIVSVLGVAANSGISYLHPSNRILDFHHIASRWINWSISSPAIGSNSYSNSVAICGIAFSSSIL